MARPPRYSRDFGFTDWSNARPDEPLPGDQVDSELDDVSSAINATQDNLALIQREDGELGNKTVGPDQLKDGLIDFIGEELPFVPGPAGPAGVAIPGPAGLPGPSGASLQWVIVDGVPSNAIGVLDQLALNSVNGDVYLKTANGWVLEANIKGPPGVGAGTNITDHGQLQGLNDADHPISAVQGLADALAGLESDVASALAQQNRVYAQAAAPAEPLNAGDLWIDTDAGNRLSRWNGAAWVDVSDARLEQALVDAAAAIDAATAAEAKADGKVTTYYLPSAPQGAELGDLWFNTTAGNKLYRWSGTAWVLVQDQGITDAIASAQNAQVTADGKITSFYQPNAPGANVAGFGDIWYDTDDKNHPYRFNGTSWASIRDATIADAAAAAATALQQIADLEATQDGVVQVYYQSAPPSAGISSVGDLWIDTDDKQMYRYSGSQWVSVRDTQITAAFTSAQLAQDAADGKITAFYQTTPPQVATANQQVGDLWYDTDDTNRPYRWNGSSWVDLTPLSGVVGGQVTSPSIANNAVTNSFLYLAQKSGTATWNLDPWIPDDNAYHDMNNTTDLNARVTVVGIPLSSGARVVISAAINGVANGLGDDCYYRIVRDDSVVVTPSDIRFGWNDYKAVFSWNFIDDAPVTTTHTYRMQCKRTSGRNTGYLTDVQLLATLYKR